MKLVELQSKFQQALLDGGEPATAEVIGAVNDSPTESREILLGVYVAAYRLRLFEFLADDYPCLKALLGEEAFDAFCEDYVAAKPSRARNARYFSAHVPEFMASRPRWSDPRAVSLAIVERALIDAVDAPDSEATLALSSLAAIDPEQWPSLSFRFDASLHLLDVAPGVAEALEAAMADEPIPPAQGAGERLLIWRCENEALWRRLDEDEYLALNEARAGQSFGAISQLVAFQNENRPAEERLAQLLTGWFQDALIVGVDVGGDADAHTSSTSSSA